MNKTINDILKKYGEPVFRLALTHLMEFGTKKLSDDEVVEKACETIMKNTAPNQFMTQEFCCDILRCSGELAKVDPWDLFSYIKVSLDIDNIKIIEGRVITFRANCTEKEYLTCIIPSDTDEEKIEEVENKISERKDAHAKAHNGDFSGFDTTFCIIEAFTQCGVKPKSIIPDMRVYI